MPNHVDELAYAFGQPACHGMIRTCVEDFLVDEVLGFEPDGAGEHVLLHLEKRNTNTQWLARQLARFAEVKQLNVSYAGLKDRHAVTRQWFSIGLAGKAEPDWSAFATKDIKVLHHARHRRKLRRGALSGNRFEIVIRHLEGDSNSLAFRLEKIKHDGVPNYFAEQRFGREGDNLQKADALFKGEIKVRDRHQRGLYLSAARSFLFNAVLSQRVETGTWNQALGDEAMLLDRSNSYFVAEATDTSLDERLASHDIHPSGPLWGQGEPASQGTARQLEADILKPYVQRCRGLEQAGLKQARRSLRLSIRDLNWNINEADQSLSLAFFLPAGCYATTVLREICITKPHL